jgi:glycerol-3-phosphate O-acyltransferase/dihydroxyacetone phosphate acyltransferase
LWLPIFASTNRAVRKLKKSGPVWDTFDEIAQTKLTYGLISFLAVYFFSILVTLPISFITWLAVPALMWMSLRWFEDAVSSFRAFTALLRLLIVGKAELTRLRSKRENLGQRLLTMAVDELGMPSDPETYFAQPTNSGGEKGRQRTSWHGGAKYFSVRRRRKRDWNETLRLYDKVDFPNET